MNNKRNLLSAILLQFVTILSGLIIPRIIISNFGSEINGIISSATQFLSFISLAEGGLGAVVLAELYLPLEKKNTEKIISILNACRKFFAHIGIIFFVYTCVISLAFGLSLRNNYRFAFISTLILIISFSTLAQYLFAVTNRLILQASQRVYIVNFVSSISIVTNLFIALIVIHFFPSIHLLKCGTGLAFLIQPFVFNHIIEKEYRTKLSEVKKATYRLKDRWSGFGQNLAHFICLNTDIIILTLFVGLNEVSVYSIYMLAINALRQIIGAADESYQSALGKYYAEGNIPHLKYEFKRFVTLNNCVVLIIFFTCLHLINPFVQLYTQGVNDTYYYAPFFSEVMVIANMFFCIREPYRRLVMSTGKFKETNFGSYFEAILNIAISLTLVRSLGLAGVAIGSLIAIIYRLFYFCIFLQKNVIFLEVKDNFVPFIFILILCVVNLLIFHLCSLTITSFISFIISGILITLVESFLVGVIYYIPLILNNKNIFVEKWK